LSSGSLEERHERRVLVEERLDRAGAVPRLESAATLASAPAELKPFVKVGLVREANKVRAILRDLRRELSHSASARLRDVEA